MRFNIFKTIFHPPPIFCSFLIWHLWASEYVRRFSIQVAQFFKFIIFLLLRCKVFFEALSYRSEAKHPPIEQPAYANLMYSDSRAPFVWLAI